MATIMFYQTTITITEEGQPNSSGEIDLNAKPNDIPEQDSVIPVAVKVHIILIVFNQCRLFIVL